MPDGAFLTPVSGLHYVLNVFDQAVSVLAVAQAGADSKIVQVQEAVRHHDDRLAYLEHRHDGLSQQSSLKLAEQAEFKDWMINRSEQDWLTVMGLPRLSNEGKREWQEAARKQVTELIRLVLKSHRVNLNFSILVVTNPLRGRTTGLNVLNVKMDSVESSSRIRDLYSGFFRHNRPVQLPPSLKGVSVRNKVTHATRIRKTILERLGDNYKASNPGATVRVRGFEPRPVLTIIPGSGTASSSSSSSRPRTYSFIDAVTTFPATFSDEALAQIYGVVGLRYPGELKQLFVVLNDDDRERCQELARAQQRDRGQRRAPVSTPHSSAGRVRGEGAGMDLEAGFLESLRSAPPPPPPSSSTKFRGPTEKLSRSRSLSASPVRSPEGQRSGRSARSRSRSTSPVKKTSKVKSRRSRSRSRSRSTDRAKRGRKRRHHSSERKRRNKKKRSRRGRRRSSTSSSSSSSSSSDSSDTGSSSSSERDAETSEKRETSKQFEPSDGSKASKSTKSEKSDKTERSEKTAKQDKSNKSRKQDKSDRSSKPDKPEKSSKNREH